MADFARWVTAAEPAFGVTGLSFAQAYKGNRESANDLALDASHVAQAAKSLVAEAPFKGTATELLAALNQKTGDEIRREKSWPKDGRGLSNRLRRLAPNLRQIGVSIKFDLPQGRGKGKKRVIELEELPDLPSPASPSGLEPENDEDKTTSGEMTAGTQIEAGTQTASLPNLASPPNQLEINSKDDGDAGDAEFQFDSDPEEDEIFEEGIL